MVSIRRTTTWSSIYAWNQADTVYPPDYRSENQHQSGLAATGGISRWVGLAGFPINIGIRPKPNDKLDVGAEVAMAVAAAQMVAHGRGQQGPLGGRQ